MGLPSLTPRALATASASLVRSATHADTHQKARPNDHQKIPPLLTEAASSRSGQREEAIAYIESGNYAFHVQVGRDDVPVTVAIRNGVKYLKTRPDHTTRDNLLSLDQCPIGRAA